MLAVEICIFKRMLSDDIFMYWEYMFRVTGLYLLNTKFELFPSKRSAHFDSGSDVAFTQ